MYLSNLVQPLRKKLNAVLGKYKFVLLIILVGVLLLTLPDFGGGTGDEATTVNTGIGSDFDLEKMEEKMEEALSKIDGAGNVTVILTVKTSARQVLAEDGSYSQKEEEAERSSSTVIISKGSGYEEVVPVQEILPQFQGALVVCAGGGNPAVKLKLVEAVSDLTGLGSDKITICKGK